MLFIVYLLAFAGADLLSYGIHLALDARRKTPMRRVVSFQDSVEAGMDFTAAVGKVVETGQASPLIEELYRMLQEIKMGKTRREALRDMSKRIGLREVNSFTGALIQADQLGTSLGPILRMQSEQCSTEREQRTEKMAMQAPVKMLFPLILFIFPTIFIIIFVPIILKIIQMKGGN